jgi:hypothetical protein
MRVLEALKILEDAVLDSLEQPADTPRVREALDTLEPFVSHSIQAFRHGLFVPNRRPYYLEAQQHNLNNSFSHIHRSVRALLDRRVQELADRSARTQDPKIKAELQRLSAELDRLPLKWAFIPRSSRH